MRRRGTVIHMVAMLALLMASLPMSAIASLFSPTCTMPCCAGKPAHMADDADCAKGCDELAGHHASQSGQHSLGHEDPTGHVGSNHDKPATGSALSKLQTEGCKCTLRSAPSTPDQPLIATISSSYHPVTADAALPKSVDLSGTVRIDVRTPGILGTDSGPPVSRPKYATLGRAPPVLLA